MRKIFFCRPLQTTTKASDMLKLVEDFFTEENLDWAKLGSVCTDGAPATIGVRSGFFGSCQTEKLDIIGMHCIIHLEALTSRTMPQSLKKTFDCAIIYYIKASALNIPGFLKNYAKTRVLNIILCYFTFLCAGFKMKHVNSAGAFITRG